MARKSCQRALGRCYYPEHWPKSWWQKDAEAMVDAGISFVRIGDFSFAL